MYVVIRKPPYPNIRLCQRYELDDFGFLYKVNIRPDGTSLGPSSDDIALPWELLEPYIAEVGGRSPEMLYRGNRLAPRPCPSRTSPDFDPEEVI